MKDFQTTRELVKVGDKYVARARFFEPDLPRAYGFTHNRTTGEWETTSPILASRMVLFAKGKLKLHLEAVREVMKGRLEASLAKNTDIIIPSPDNQRYLPFQRAGVDFIRRCDGNALLADEMGLGKTVQAIGYLNTVLTEGNTVLILCPAIGKEVWRAHIEDWLTVPLDYHVVYGDDWQARDIMVVNYALLHRYRDIICARTWDVLIADEAHYLKTPTTKRSKAAYAIPRKRTLLLTGTPSPSHLIDIHALLKMIDPVMWKSKWWFAHRWCDAHKDAYGKLDMNGFNEERSKELYTLLRSTCMIRRKKAKVLPDLPPKFRQIVPLCLPDTALKHIQDEMSLNLKEESLKRQLAQLTQTDADHAGKVSRLSADLHAIGGRLASARKETGLLKVPFAIDMIRDSVSPEHKVVVFIFHIEVAELLFKAFPDAVMIIGSTPMNRRTEYINAFQSPGAPQLFIGNMIACGTTITLTASSHVIFVEQDWTPARFTQAEDRCLTKNNLVFCPWSVKDGGMSIKSISKIAVGDKVLNMNGRETEVVAVQKRTDLDGRITRIKYAGWEDPLECTYNHKVFIMRIGDPRPRWIKAHEIIPGDRVLVRRPSVSVCMERIEIQPEWRRYERPRTSCIVGGCKEKIEARQMCGKHYREYLDSTPPELRKPGWTHTNGRYLWLPDAIDITDDWLYTFGYFLANGFSSIRGGKASFVSLACHKKKKRHVLRCAKAFRSVGAKVFEYPGPGNGVEFRAYSYELAMWFRSWFGHGAHNKTIPDIIMHLPPRQAIIVLEGYLDGDGYRRRNRSEWCSASEVMAYQFCLLAMKCGYSPTLRRGSVASGRHWIGGFAAMSYSRSSYLMRRVRSTETAYERRPTVYDITVASGSSFVTGFCTVHNCHRHGQKDNVLVQHLVFDDSLDAYMAKMVVRKQSVSNAVLDGG